MTRMKGMDKSLPSPSSLLASYPRHPRKSAAKISYSEYDLFDLNQLIVVRQ